MKIDAKALDLILYGRDPIELRFVEQLVDRSQTRAIGYAIHLATQRFMDGKTPLADVLDRLEEFFDRSGLDVLDPFRRGERHPGAFARPCRYEIAAAIKLAPHGADAPSERGPVGPLRAGGCCGCLIFAYGKLSEAPSSACGLPVVRVVAR